MKQVVHSSIVETAQNAVAALWDGTEVNPLQGVTRESLTKAFQDAITAYLEGSSQEPIAHIYEGPWGQWKAYRDQDFRPIFPRCWTETKAYRHPDRSDQMKLINELIDGLQRSVTFVSPHYFPGTASYVLQDLKELIERAKSFTDASEANV